MEVILHAVLLDEAGNIVEVTPDSKHRRWMVVINPAIDFYTTLAYVHRTKPIPFLKMVVNNYGWDAGFSAGLHYVVLPWGYPNSMLVEMATQKLSIQMITQKELNEKVHLHMNISEALVVFVVMCGVYIRSI